MSIRSAVLTGLLSLLALAPRTSASPESATAVPRRRVLVLYQQQPEEQPMLEFTQRLRMTLRRELGANVELYQEALDLDRFHGPDHTSSLARYLSAKYRGVGLDAIVPVGGQALEFAIHALRDVLPDTPLVFALCAYPRTDPSTLPSGVTGRMAPETRFDPTIAMARRLQPDADHVVVVGGAGRSDSASVAAVVGAVARMRDPLRLTVVEGLSLDALFRTLRRLPPRSIVVFANYREDARRQVFEPFDIVSSIARAAAAPVYTQLASYIGEGVVGGSVTRFDDEGVRTARLVARVIRRRPGEPLPPVERIDNAFVVDARQLMRWGLPEGRLPSGTSVLFREPSLWERYWMVVILTLAVVAAQLYLIGRLLLERRHRRRAQMIAEEERQRAQEGRRQMIHVGRVALVGELAATIAHDLRQPLAAIRTNAESGARLSIRQVRQEQSDEWATVRDILADIAHESAQAADIISRTRALLRREELPFAVVNLNDVCRDATRIVESDAQARGARLVLSLAPGLPEIMGDAVQLQQVVLNLAMNAVDACASSAAPCVTVSTAARAGDAELVVRDNGSGLPPDVRARLFESFFTTKPTGLGLGLVIAKSVVERHRGTIRAHDDPAGGAVFRVVLPRARSTGGGSEQATSDDAAPEVSPPAHLLPV